MNIEIEAAKMANACQRHYTGKELSQSAIDAIAKIIDDDLNGTDFSDDYIKSADEYKKYVESASVQ